MLVQPPYTFASRQHGQVMPLTLVFILSVILALWVMYDSGQVMSEKIRLQNTADNVAYSTAALVSRDLNFVAYTNRGMAANQVAIGQVVGIGSYLKFAETAGRNLGIVANILEAFVYTTPIGAALDAIAEGIEDGASGLEQGWHSASENVILPANNGLISLLSEAQFVYHQATLGLVANVSRQVGEMNDPDAMSFFQVGNSTSLVEPATLYTEWSRRISEQHEPQPLSDSSSEAQLDNARIREFHRVVLDSRDTFSKARSYDWPEPFSGVMRGIPEVRYTTRKYGGSEFERGYDPQDDMYKWDWTAMDTAALYIEACFPVVGGFDCFDPFEDFGGIPISWGAAHSLDEDASSDYHDYSDTPSHLNRRNNAWGNGTWRNTLAAVAAAGEFSDHNIQDTKGLKGFYDFQDDGRGNDFGPATMSIYIKDAGGISSQQNIIEGAGGVVAEDLETNTSGALIGNRIAAVAKAQPYFARAADLSLFARADGLYEHGNLYNPFWQPRLVELSDAEKTAVSAAVASGIDLNAGGGS